MCVCWGWCVRVCAPVCVCVLMHLLSPPTPRSSFLYIDSWTQWHPITLFKHAGVAKSILNDAPAQAANYRCVWGRQHKTRGERSRQTDADVCCCMSHSVAPQGKWIRSSSDEIDKVFHKSDIINAFLYHKWENMIGSAPTSKWRQGCTGDGNPDHANESSLLCWVYFRESSESYNLWRSDPVINKRHDWTCKHTAIFSGECFMLVTHLWWPSVQHVSGSCCLLKLRVTEILNRSHRVR